MLSVKYVIIQAEIVQTNITIKDSKADIIIIITPMLWLYLENFP